MDFGVWQAVFRKLWLRALDLPDLNHATLLDSAWCGIAKMRSGYCKDCTVKTWDAICTKKKAAELCHIAMRLDNHLMDIMDDILSPILGVTRLFIANSRLLNHTSHLLLSLRRVVQPIKGMMLKHHSPVSRNAVPVYPRSNLQPLPRTFFLSVRPRRYCSLPRAYYTFHNRL